MPLRTYCWLGSLTVRWILFLSFNFIFTLIRNVVWLCNGTYFTLKASRRPENYATSAHVRNIVTWFRLDEFIETRLSDYILIHDEFVHPEYVLRDDVYFMQVTDKEALFVQSKRGSKPVFAAFSFVIFGQMLAADRVIVLPIESFHRLAENMETEGKILFLHNQARCGGTLFSQLFRKSGRCVVFNEPHAINALCKYYFNNKQWSREQMIRMLRNTVKVLCKPYRGYEKPVLAYVIKPTALSMCQIELIKEAVPEAVQYFIYRDPVLVGISIRRLAEALPTILALMVIPNIPKAIGPLLAFTGYCGVDFKGWTPKTGANLEFGYRIGASTIKYHLHAQKHGVTCHGVRFEDLRDHPQKMVSRVFELAGLPSDIVPKALEAMAEDSQADTVIISQETLRKLTPNPPKPTPEFLEAAREMALEFDNPTPDSWKDLNFRLEGSIVP